MTDAVKKNGVNFGIILGIVSILIGAAIYAIDLELMVTIWVGILIFLINVVIAIVAVSKSKSQLGGFITFKEAFTTYFITIALGTLIGLAFSFVLYNLIDPGAKETMTNLIVEKSVGWMQSAGLPNEDIRKAVEEMKATDNFSPFSLLKSYVMSLAFYSVVGLIIAAVMKKNKPEFN